MSALLERQTPANYIHFAIAQPRGIAPHQYKEQLIALLKDPCDNAGEAFLAFKRAAQLNTNLSSTFYSAVCEVFKKLRGGVSQPQRWNGKMEALIKTSEDDPTLLKYLRETLMGGTLPDLIASHATDANLQVAADIMSVASKSPTLADTIKQEYVRPIVMWHFRNAHQNFEIAAPHFTTLRASLPFLSAITHLENKHGVHVDSEKLPHDDKKNLVLKFSEAHGGSLDVWVVDLSKASRANHPHQIPFKEAATKYKDSVSKILLRSTDLDNQAWVSPIATEAYCSLG